MDPRSHGKGVFSADRVCLPKRNRHMKKSFWDFFRREFEVRLSLSPRDAINAGETQLNGVSMLSSLGEECFPVREDPGIENTFDLLRKLRPGILRFSAFSPDFDRWINFCKSEEIDPHICFAPDSDPEQAIALVKRCAADFAENDLWQPVRFYEVICDPDAVSPENDSITEERIESVRKLGKLLRAADPEARIIIGAIAPIGEKRTQAEIWNCGILQKCADFMDMIGIFLQPSLPAGHAPDDDTDAVEARVMLAEQIADLLPRTNLQDMPGKPLPSLERQEQHGALSLHLHGVRIVRDD